MEKIFVGNLPFTTTENDLQKLFSKYGAVKEIRLIRDKAGAGRGFGFVEMENAAGAIQELDESDYQKRLLRVKRASERGNW